MIGAIAGLSALGGSLALARTIIVRAEDASAAQVSNVDGLRGLRGTGTTSPAKGTGGAQAYAAAAATTKPADEEAGDTAEISPQGRAKATAASAGTAAAASEDLSPEQAEQLRKLRERDKEVRAHEAAHQAAGGRYAGSASFTYQTGPDGRSYAIGGEVPIDLSTDENNPEATIAKMQQVRAAASAPADPSGADRQVAAEAARIEQEARAEQMAQNTQAAGDESETSSGSYGDEAESSSEQTSRETPTEHIDVYA